MLKGIVFEGGGAKGAYQIGAAKALMELGFEFDAIAGTSVGALNGVAVAQDEIQRAYEIWETLEPENVFNMEAFSAARKDKRTYIKLAKKIIEDRGLDTEPLTKLITDFVDEEKIRKRDIIFGIVTFMLNDMKPIEVYLEDIPIGKLKDYIIASANFPIFKTMRIDGKMYSDGGIYNNYPINLLIDKGIEDIVSVRTFGIGRIRSCDIKNARILHIEPKEKLGPILDFSKERILKNLKLGYNDAYRVVKGYIGERYYIIPDISEDEICWKLFCINKDSLKELSDMMGETDADPTRYFFEVLMPRAAEYTGLDESAGYIQVLIAIFEHLAQEKGIERFCTYTFSDFIKKVYDAYRDDEDEDEYKDIGTIEGFFARKDLMQKSMKLRILRETGLLVLKSLK